MSSEDESDKKFYLERSITYYQILNANSDDYRKNFVESLEIIKKSDSNQIKEFFDIVMKIGDKIKKYLLSQNIQSIEDLRMIIVKLKSIRTISRENEFNFSGFAKSILDEFHYKSDVEYYIREYGDRDISKELIKLKGSFKFNNAADYKKQLTKILVKKYLVSPPRQQQMLFQRSKRMIDDKRIKIGAIMI